MSLLTKPKTISLIAILLAGLLGLYTSNKYFNKSVQIEYQSLLLYPKLKTFSGFELNDKNNKKLTIDDFANKWTLLFFGFTSCPDVCPTTLTELQRVYKYLDKQNLKQKPEVLFISVDPERDTADKLKNYINFFNPEFNAASGDRGSLLSLSSQIGVAYNIEEHESGSLSYNVDHTAALFLVNPQKQLYGIFQSPHDETKIASDLEILMEQK
jgi:protein SCO1/2